MPGAVDGWVQAHARFGRLPFADCLRPAIDLARDGFPVAESPARYAAEHRDLLAATPSTAAAYLGPGGAPPRRGDVVRLPRLADTLEAIAADGPRRVLRGRDRRRDRGVPRARTAAS